MSTSAAFALYLASLLAALALLIPATVGAQGSAPDPLLPPVPPVEGPISAASARAVEVSEEEVVRGDPNLPNVSLVVNVGADRDCGAPIQRARTGSARGANLACGGFCTSFGRGARS